MSDELTGDEPTILVHDDGQVRIVTLNRPHRKNALDIPMRARLAELMLAADADPAVRAIVITGAGGAFCSGADVGVMERMEMDRAVPRVETAQKIARAITGINTPVVAAVEGIAFGAGLGIALACDHLIATTSAKFNAGFMNVGLGADLGVLWSLPHRIGLSRTRTMLMLAQTVEADEALAIGLVDAQVEPGTALDAALEVARTLAAKPPLAFAALKAAVYDRPTTLSDALDRETAAQARLLGTEDFLEAITAFTEKRKPTFQGK